MVIIFIIPIVFLAVLVALTSFGPILFWSKRVGQSNKYFDMPKFRTMKVGAPLKATHLLVESNLYITPIGFFLRKSSLDELPQIWSVLKGDMSFVGPRPALFNQLDLIEQRNKKGLDILVPGLTGWAQVNGRDELTIEEKVELDLEYLKYKSFWFDIKILWLTILKVIKRDGVLH